MNLLSSKAQQVIKMAYLKNTTSGSSGGGGGGGSSSSGGNGGKQPQLILMILLSSMLAHVLGQVQLVSAAGGPSSSSSSSSETTSSSQPLWSYQVKPGSYINAPSGQPGAPYSAMPSIFDAFNGLSQRQGALSGSPFLSILPIILIAAGGILLLLPFLTMMMASPFSGAGFGGYGQGGFGYPQMAAAMGKKRSLADQMPGQGPRGGAGQLGDLIENFSSVIDELTRKYSVATNSQQANVGQPNRRGKAINLTSSQPITNDAASQATPANHKQQLNVVAAASAPTSDELNGNNGNSLSGSNLAS